MSLLGERDRKYQKRYARSRARPGAGPLRRLVGFFWTLGILAVLAAVGILLWPHLKTWFFTVSDAIE